MLVGASRYSLIAVSRGENVKIIDIFLSLRDRQYFFTLDSLQGILKYTSTSPERERMNSDNDLSKF